MVQPYFLARLMDPWQGRWLRDALESTEGTRTNRDLMPSLLYYTLAYKNAEVQPRAALGLSLAREVAARGAPGVPAGNDAALCLLGAQAAG